MKDVRKEILAGLVSAGVIFFGTMGVGRMSEGKAYQLFEHVQPTLRFLCSSVMTGTVTILALILTLLSFTSSRDLKFAPTHYDRIKWIAKITTITFIASVIELMFLSVPLLDSDNDLSNYYRMVYYIAQTYSALLGGALITIALALYDAAKDIITVLHPEKDAGNILMKNEEAEDS